MGPQSADVAQGQSCGFVNRRLWVRFPPSALGVSWGHVSSEARRMSTHGQTSRVAFCFGGGQPPMARSDSSRGCGRDRIATRCVVPFASGRKASCPASPYEWRYFLLHPLEISPCLSEPVVQLFRSCCLSIQVTHGFPLRAWRGKSDVYFQCILPQRLTHTDPFGCTVRTLVATEPLLNPRPQLADRTSWHRL